MRSIETILEDKKYFLAGHYDVAVIGAGHAGIEAAYAASKLGKKVILFTLSLDALANLPCNPNIGGSAKGQLTREIAALGGIMPEIADKAGIQFRMLNRSKGPAVRAPRAQMDRRKYQVEMKNFLERVDNLLIHQAEIVELLVRSDEGVTVVEGVVTKTHAVYEVKRTIIATGTYLDSTIIIGEYMEDGGPDHQQSAVGLGDCLKELGLPMRRFKTGTPVRINLRSIDLDKLEVQEGDEEPWTFSFRYNNEPIIREHQLPCYITWTNEDTARIVQENLERSPLYSGEIEGIGPRYCPSFEDKIVKFPNRERHQLFIEPMEAESMEMYVQGLSSSMPEEVQLKFLHTIPGLEHAQVQRIGYAIEYECLDPTSLTPDLALKDIKNLYSAGQMNGTSGYEEAAGQGLIAGINAARSIDGLEPFVLDRSQAYIGVLIDDLVTEGTNEPYRMMSARAEYRLLLRQDNADLRLSDLGYTLGLLSEEQYHGFTKRKEALTLEIERLRNTRIKPSDEVNAFLLARGTAALEGGVSLADLLKRPEITYLDLAVIDNFIQKNNYILAESVENEIKYEGYIKIEERRIEKFQRMEQRSLPEDIDYHRISGLRLEARQKLDQIRPLSVGQASRISGVSPADITVLLVYLESKKEK